MSDDDEWADTENVDGGSAGGGWDDDGIAGGAGADDDGDGWGSGNDEFEVDDAAGGDAAGGIIGDSMSGITGTNVNGINNMSLDVQIANMFYEAEDMMRDAPNEALEKFKSIISLIQPMTAAVTSSPSTAATIPATSLTVETRSTYFHALLHAVILLHRMNRSSSSGSSDGNGNDEMMKMYTQLLHFIPYVTRNEGSDAVERVLNAVSSSSSAGSSSSKALQQIYELTSQTLQSLPDTERMVFNINMKLCKIHVDAEDYDGAAAILKTLHRSCQTPVEDGSSSGSSSGRGGGGGTVVMVDDRKNKGMKFLYYFYVASTSASMITLLTQKQKFLSSSSFFSGSELLEIYAVEIRMSLAQHNVSKMRELYEATKDLSAAVKDPRSQSVIRECWGLMFGHDGQWQRAYAEFYSAFQAYQEIGQRDRAKQCLQYVVVANLLAGGQQVNCFKWSLESFIFFDDQKISLTQTNFFSL